MFMFFTMNNHGHDSIKFELVMKVFCYREVKEVVVLFLVTYREWHYYYK